MNIKVSSIYVIHRKLEPSLIIQDLMAMFHSQMNMNLSIEYMTKRMMGNYQ